MFLLIAFTFIAVLFLIVAGLVGLVIRLAGRRGRTKTVFKWCALTYLVGAPTLVFVGFPIRMALVHESELARNEPDSQVHHLPRAYDDGLPSSAIRLRM